MNLDNETDDNIRLPDEQQFMRLIDSPIHNNRDTEDIELDLAIKRSLEEMKDMETLDIGRILIESKEDYELLQQIREIEEVEELERQTRTKIFANLQQKIRKISNYDEPNKDIYELILSTINNYININNFVSLALDKTHYEAIQNVLKLIRLTNDDLENIKKLFTSS
jgi:hypothetical protein